MNKDIENVQPYRLPVPYCNDVKPYESQSGRERCPLRCVGTKKQVCGAGAGRRPAPSQKSLICRREGVSASAKGTRQWATIAVIAAAQPHSSSPAEQHRAAPWPPLQPAPSRTVYQRQQRSAAPSAAFKKAVSSKAIAWQAARQPRGLDADVLDADGFIGDQCTGPGIAPAP